MMKVMAMEMATAQTVFDLFECGRAHAAIQTLRENRGIQPAQLAAIDGIERYFHYLSQVTHFKFSRRKWPQVMRNFSETPTIRAVLASDCNALKLRWLQFSRMRHDMINVVQALYILSRMDIGIRVYNAQHGRENARVQQELAEVGAECLDMELYEAKVEQLRQAPELRVNAGDNAISVSRFHLLETAEPAIMRLAANQARSGTFSVTFQGEPAIDAGGPKREFFSLVSRVLFNPDMALFNFSAGGNYCLQVHHLSTFKREEWHLYRFAGRFLAMAIIHKQPIGTKFSSAFYKSLLGHPYEAEDLKDIDGTIYEAVQYIIDHDPEVLMLTFTVSVDEFGRRREIELKPNGANIDVTDDNKAEYVHLLIQYHTNHLVSQQMELIRRGFFEIIPQRLISIFSCAEFRFLLSGLTRIDVDDWKANTVYQNCDANHEVIRRFWRMVEFELDNRQRGDLLQFVTGSPFVPVTGFKDLQGSNGCLKKFNIQFNQWTDSPAIVSHTCFNQLCIPRHSSETQFKEYMMQAILNKEGFGTS